jgi:hypothetical protein
MAMESDSREVSEGHMPERGCWTKERRRSARSKAVDGDVGGPKWRRKTNLVLEKQIR